MKKLSLAAACALIGAVALWLTVFRPSEEDKVRKVLERFTQAVRVRPDDNVLSRSGRLRSELAETVMEGVYVDVADLNIRVSNRAALVDSATKAGLLVHSAECSLTATTIKIDEAATTAKADTLAVITAERGGERKVDKRAVHFLLRKDDGWRIASIDVAAASP